MADSLPAPAEFAVFDGDLDADWTERYLRMSALAVDTEAKRAVQTEDRPTGYGSAVWAHRGDIRPLIEVDHRRRVGVLLPIEGELEVTADEDAVVCGYCDGDGVTRCVRAAVEAALEGRDQRLVDRCDVDGIVTAIVL